MFRKGKARAHEKTLFLRCPDASPYRGRPMGTTLAHIFYLYKD
jgi:hypothetical protein